MFDDHQVMTSAIGMQGLWLGLAIAVHGAAFAALPASSVSVDTPSSLDLAEIELLEPISEPTPDQEDREVERVKAPPKPRTPKPPPEPTEPSDEPPAAADEVPFAFDDFVLSNQPGASWQIDSRPDAVVTGRNVDGEAGGVIGGEGTALVVDLGDLSRQPKPPDLKRKLERNYPKKAQSEGKEGVAQVRLQVNSDGSVSRLVLHLEEPKDFGFGQACIRTLTGERWKPPVDGAGRRVATRVTYSCRFKVRY